MDSLNYVGSLIVLLCVALSGVARVGPTQKLENEEYGFSVRIPVDAVSCLIATGTHPHGFSILLKPDRQGCKSSTQQPYVGVSGDYNTLDDETPEQSLRILCPQQQSSSQNKSLNLSFPRHASASCESFGKDGWVDVFVVAQAGRWPKETSKTPYIIYTAQLHTSTARLDEDVATFKKILSGIIIAPK